MAGLTGAGRHWWRGSGSRVAAHWPRAVRLAGVLALIVGSAGMLFSPAAQAAQHRHVLARLQVAVPASTGGSLRPANDRWLWRPGDLRQGEWLPPAPGSAAAPGGTWLVEATPNPAVQRNGTLLAVSCTARSACTAVGSDFNDLGITVPLAERWNGARWAIQAVPSPAGAAWSRLFGVSCASASDCTAAGYYYNGAGATLPVAEHWNGARWAIQATPSPVGAPAAGFFAVSCAAPAACTAVGEYDTSLGKPQTLAERWNGTSWTIEDTPNPTGAQASALFAVSCAGPGACTAAGAYTDSTGATLTLAQAWHGTSWTIQAEPAPAGATGSELTAVSCTAAGACTAVGSYTTSTRTSVSLAERWNGTRWATQAVPGPAGATGSELTAVSCTATRACAAVGLYARSAGPAQPQAEAWNGARWAVQAVPGPVGSAGAEFSGLACTSARACAAAGAFSPGAGETDVTLAEAWNGTRWAIEATPSPVGAGTDTLFDGVSCVSARACTAVGSYSKTPTLGVTLAEAWNGSRWRIQATPNPKGATGSFLQAVSCASKNACAAVGSYLTRSGAMLAFAETWNGTLWRLQATPVPAGSSGSRLAGVSCTSPRACTAVGAYTTSTGAGAGLAERWNGSKWGIQAVAKPAARQAPQLYAVSCTSPARCTAGGYDLRNGEAQPLIEAWNGTSWHVQKAPLPAGSPGGTIMAVSCASPDACTATGANFSSTNAPLADRWNGTSWRSQTTLPPPAASTSTSEIHLAGVSCASARSCVAVGGYTPRNVPAAFIEAWNGTKWSLQTTATPPGTIKYTLNGVSCAAARCTAAGAYTGLTGIVVTLAMTTPA
jgi:hypothetical protein